MVIPRKIIDKEMLIKSKQKINKSFQKKSMKKIN